MVLALIHAFLRTLYLYAYIYIDTLKYSFIWTLIFIISTIISAWFYFKSITRDIDDMIVLNKSPISNTVKIILILTNFMEYFPVLIAMILWIYHTGKMKLINDNTNNWAMMKKIDKLTRGE